MITLVSERARQLRTAELLRQLGQRRRFRRAALAEDGAEKTEAALA